MARQILFFIAAVLAGTLLQGCSNAKFEKKPATEAGQNSVEGGERAGYVWSHACAERPPSGEEECFDAVQICASGEANTNGTLGTGCNPSEGGSEDGAYTCTCK